MAGQKLPGLKGNWPTKRDIVNLLHFETDYLDYLGGSWKIEKDVGSPTRGGAWLYLTIMDGLLDVFCRF
jgi:hypothetical protein